MSNSKKLPDLSEKSVESINSGDSRLAANLNINCSEVRRPVSYTHLDVYKRQRYALCGKESEGLLLEQDRVEQAGYQSYEGGFQLEAVG